MSNHFITIHREESITLPPNFEGWLSGKSLARFIVDIIERIDTTEIESSYSGGGSKPYPPKMMLALIFYCYVNGIFSSRKIEAATRELIPAIFIANGHHPDHTSIATFRKRFIGQFKPIFVSILEVAVEMGILKLGDVSIDGTKIHANASKHKAMSWKYARKLKKQLEGEIALLLKKAEEAQSDDDNSDVDFPGEIQRREQLIEKIDSVAKTIEARRKLLHEQEQKEYEEKMRARAEKEKITGKKAGGRAPKPPSDKPKDTDQVNFTDEESRIMPTSGGGFEQAYNAQATVDMDSRLIVGNHITQNTNDKNEVTPALEELQKLPESAGKVERAALDAGYHSEENLKKLEEAGIEAHIPSGRQKHNKKIEDILAKEPEPPDDPDVVEAMKYRMNTQKGKDFYAKRKSTVEPIFGVIKHVIGFRQFMLRGLNSVTGEWNLVCSACNLKRLFVLNSQTAG